MHLGLKIATVGVFILAEKLSAQDSKPLPDKVMTLKFNYEAAINRATTPITQTYVQELQKLKNEYTKAGNLEAALATDAILKELSDQPSPALNPSATNNKVSKMGMTGLKEMEAVSQTAASSNSTPGNDDRLFVAKSWFTKAGSEYHFNRDGTGYRFQKMDFDDKVVFTWRQLPDGVVEAIQRKQPNAQPSATYFRFIDRNTAYQGESATNIAAPLSSTR